MEDEKKGQFCHGRKYGWNEDYTADIDIKASEDMTLDEVIKKILSYCDHPSPKAPDLEQPTS